MRYRIRVDDENGLIHLHGDTYFERGSGDIIWEFLNFHIFETDHDDWLQSTCLINAYFILYSNGHDPLKSCLIASEINYCKSKV